MGGDSDGGISGRGTEGRRGLGKANYRMWMRMCVFLEIAVVTAYSYFMLNPAMT